jgi:hypothetical protein
MKNATRHFAAWVAMLAMLCAMVAPSIFHAVAAARGEVFVEMCGISGTKLVAISGDPSEQPTPSAPDHCKLCSMHGETYALPSSMQAAMFPADAGERYPFLFFQSSSPLAVWSPVQSRAPPASI